MMKNYLKQIKIGILLTVFAFGIFINPRPLNAQWTVTEVGGSLFQQIAIGISSATTAISSYSDEFKEYVLDPAITMIAKTLIREFTTSMIEWINGGFEGSPSFITNPGSFFLNTADQITGEFLAQNGGPLTELCSPFSIDIRIALAFKYHQKPRKQYSCTLSKIITNTRNAAENATLNGKSIGGFMNGDFNQGGWPAFVSLTTVPANNVYGAYLTADSELSVRVASAQGNQRAEIQSGSGILSWRDPKCKDEVKRHNAQVQRNYQMSSEEAFYESANNGTGEGYYSGEVGEMKSLQDCPIKTPGSLIQGSIQNHLDGPLRELEIADEFNEILGAAMNQLVRMTITKGFGAVTGSGPSDSTSYINQVRQEAAGADAARFSENQNAFIISVEKYIMDTLQFKNYKQQSLNLVTQVEDIYTQTKVCYAQKINSNQPPLSPYQKSYAEGKIAEINAKIAQEIPPLKTPTLTQFERAQAQYDELTGIKYQAETTTSTVDMRELQENYAQLVRDRTLPDANDISSAQQEVEQYRTATAPLKLDAERKYQECQSFPTINGGGTIVGNQITT